MPTLAAPPIPVDDIALPVGPEPARDRGRQQEGAAGQGRGDRRPTPERRRTAAPRLAGGGLLGRGQRNEAACRACSTSPARHGRAHPVAPQGRDPRARARLRAVGRGLQVPRARRDRRARARDRRPRQRRAPTRSRSCSRSSGRSPRPRTSSRRAASRYAKDVLERALGDEKALEIMGRLSSYIRLSPFEFLRSVEPQQIYNFLQNEHPQTVALVLSYLRERVGSDGACRCSRRSCRARSRCASP